MFYLVAIGLLYMAHPMAAGINFKLLHLHKGWMCGA